jgi:serine/threonine protein kinase
MAEDIYTPDRAALYHFKLNRILGKGGTGIVYRAIDQKEGRVVAIKRFYENFFRNALHLRDLKKSVKKFKKFKHDNVVQIFDFYDSSEDDGNCMVMEYVDGPNLVWYLRNRPFKLQERLSFCQQIGAGLQYLHENGCVHHDFKPANVLFTRKGKVKIADYSLYGGSILLELFDRSIGEQITPMYVAPEFIRKEKVTAAADQYSLGVTMYMMFANKFPYEADSLQKLYYAHVNLQPIHPTEVNPACGQNLGDIIMRLMEKKPEKRFKDLDELNVALSRVGTSRI